VGRWTTIARSSRKAPSDPTTSIPVSLRISDELKRSAVLVFPKTPIKKTGRLV
jgi:hypothetical protein